MLSVSEGFKTAVSAISRQFAAYVEVYFDGVTATTFYSTDKLVSFSLLEELSASSDSPLGAVSANEIDIVLENSTRCFTPTNPNSPYYGKLLPNIKVKPYIGIKVAGSFEYVPLGTFYTGDWDVPGDQILASIRCTDCMVKVFDKKMPQVPVFENTTITELYSSLFELAGLSTDDYIIDTEVNQSIQYGWYTEGTYKEGISKLASSSCTNVFTTKESKIRVANILTPMAPVFTFSDTDTIKTSAMPIKYFDTYSKVNVDYAIPNIADQDTILNLNDLSVPTDGLTISRSSFSSGPVGIVEQIILTPNEYVTITSVTYGAWDISIVLANSDTSAHTVNIEVLGRVIDTTKTTYVLTNSEIEALIGEKELTLTPYLIQTAEKAQEYAAIIDNLVHDPSSKVTASTRGNPAIELGDVVTIINPSHRMSAVDMIVTRISLDFTGGLSSEIEGISLTALSFPFIRLVTLAEATSNGSAPVVEVT